MLILVHVCRAVLLTKSAKASMRCGHVRAFTRLNKKVMELYRVRGNELIYLHSYACDILRYCTVRLRLRSSAFVYSSSCMRSQLLRQLRTQPNQSPTSV